jgi:hypothetical protein
MNEEDYIRATNLAKIRIAISIIQDIVADKEDANYGISQEDKKYIIKELTISKLDIENKISSL